MGRIQEADGFAAPGVMDWSDISRVAVSPFHAVGLKDGCLASGDIQLWTMPSRGLGLTSPVWLQESAHR